ncbi:MAG: hypothetical protein M9890_12870 [Thermomicrobiales bacterium]|nr:hypothetical protein [Thermomicrobiales bacterium]
MELLAGLVLSLTAAVVGAWQITRRDRPLHGPLDDGSLGLPRIQRWNESYRPPRFQRLRARFPRLQMSRFGITLVVIMLVAGSAIVIYTRSASQSATRQQQFATGIAKVDERLLEARATSDVTTAYAILIEAQAELAELARIAPDEAAQEQLVAQQTAIDGEIAHLSISAPVIGTQLVGAFPAAPGGITPQVVTFGDRIFLLSDAVYEVDPINATLIALLKPGDVVGDGSVLPLRAITWRDDRLQAIDAKRSYTMDPATGKWNAEQLSTFDTAGHVDATAAASFDGNLYLLMPNDNTILKFQADAYNGTPEDWVGNSVKESLNNAVDFAIDGHVYVLLRDGHVLDFLRSRLEATYAPSVVPPLSDASAIVVNPDSQFIYVLHEPDGRILRLTRSGMLAQQITMGDAAGRVSGAIGLAVNEEKNLAYVTTRNALFTVRLPEPPTVQADEPSTAGDPQ